MMKMVLLLTPLFILCSLSFYVAGQERVQIITLHHDSAPFTLQAISQNLLPLELGVFVNQENLNGVSSTILKAEKWVRAHVLSHYPSTNISTIVVGSNLLCTEPQEQQDGHNSGMLLPSMKNIHHSLTRWGLNREIKVSVSLSSNCFHQDYTQIHINPILSFLQEVNSTYSLNPPHETLELVDSHSKSMKNLGFVHINKLNLIIPISKQTKPTSRKLSFVESIPALPTNLAPTPSHSSHNRGSSSVPAYTATSPLPPLIGISWPPFAPEMPPLVGPGSPPPYPFNLPPCNPYNGGGGVAAPPVVGVEKGLWCVAKPSVPWDKLQVAMDYACGEGGADCEAIGPSGSCYFPDSVVAHASYAFNSYWQKKKNVGGTCGFGGTAMLINSDPSFLHCRFSLS